MRTSPLQQSKRVQFHYQKGRTDGFALGRMKGFEQGCNDSSIQIQSLQMTQADQSHKNEIALTYDPSNRIEIDKQLILTKWQELNWGQLVEDRFECLKNTTKSSIWKLYIRTQETIRPIILKVIKAHENIREESLIELNMYLKADEVMSDVMPQIYGAASIHGDAWILLEYVNPLEGQLSFHPDYFDQIIPSLAKMHSLTYNERFYFREDVFMTWIPIYNTKPVYLQRSEKIGETINLLDKAMKKSDLAKLIKPSYKELKTILLKGPNYFPQLIDAGHSIIHHDLQLGNIGCNDISESPWEIKFIDWEGARFYPCWMDLANLVGVFLSYRTDWKAEEEQIISYCAQLYALEMNKLGIHFEEDPVKLYKMAEVQRLLEKGLWQQLHWAMDKSYKGVLLKGSIPKVIAWSRELGLSHE